MKVIAYHGDEEFTLDINSLENIGKKITIINDKKTRTFNIINTETIFMENLYHIDGGEKMFRTIDTIKIYLELA